MMFVTSPALTEMVENRMGVYIPLYGRFEDNQGRVQFEIATIELPLAADSWLVRWAGHPEVSFEDLRAGHLPKPSADELAARREAIKSAHEIRAKLDIRPLTTQVLIRQLRDGSEE